MSDPKSLTVSLSIVGCVGVETRKRARPGEPDLALYAQSGAQTLADGAEHSVLQRDHASDDGAVGNDVDPLVIMHPAPAAEEVSPVAEKPNHENRDQERHTIAYSLGNTSFYGTPSRAACHHASVRAVRVVDGQTRVVNLPAPESAESARVVDVAVAGICGSDVHMLAEGNPGVTLGHEFSIRLSTGTVAAVRPTGACGSCRSCATGRIHLCDRAFGAFHGGVLDGAWADKVAVDPATIFPVASHVTPSAAALVEPVAVAVHGLRRAPRGTVERIGIVGGGSVGLCAAFVLRSWGLDVDIEARYVHQQRAAEEIGANVGLSGRYDIVVDAVGSQSALDAAVRACGSGGSIVELGVFWDAVSLTREITLREISLIPALFYGHEHDTSDFDHAIELIAARPEIESILVTHRFPLEDVAEAVRVAGERSSGAIKVQLLIGE